MDRDSSATEDRQDENRGGPAPREARKPWSTPRVIVSDIASGTRLKIQHAPESSTSQVFS